MIYELQYFFKMFQILMLHYLSIYKSSGLAIYLSIQWFGYLSIYLFLLLISTQKTSSGMTNQRHSTSWATSHSFCWVSVTSSATGHRSRSCRQLCRSCRQLCRLSRLYQIPLPEILQVSQMDKIKQDIYTYRTKIKKDRQRERKMQVERKIQIHRKIERKKERKKEIDG